MGDPEDDSASAAPPQTSLLIAIVRSLRPRQWVKNVFVFAALVFAARLDDPHSVLLALIAFASFCAVSGAVYLVNDITDREGDRHHPRKKHRPIATGALPVPVAASAAAAIFAAGCFGAASLGASFLASIGVYVAINIGYSTGLKRVPLLDVILIATGFVVRAVAGGLAIDVYVSPWLLACTFFLALFLAIGKRRHEVVLLGDDATTHRGALAELDARFFDLLSVIVTPCCILAYTLYTISSGQPVALVYTVPFVVYGFFRYLFLMHVHELGGDPTDVLFGDRGLQITLLTWAIAATAIVYS